MQGVAKVLVAQHDVYKGFLAGETHSFLLAEEAVLGFVTDDKIVVNLYFYSQRS